jgi:hypothetical protein
VQGAGVLVAEQAEHQAQFGQCLLADFVGGGQGLAGMFGLAADQVQGRTGLDVAAGRRARLGERLFDCN